MRGNGKKRTGTLGWSPVSFRLVVRDSRDTPDTWPQGNERSYCESVVGIHLVLAIMLLVTITSSINEVKMNADYIAYESLVATRNTAEWAFWSMVGTWFSGIATFMAVCLTLYISNRRPRPKLRGTVSLGGITGQNVSTFGVTINIANVGIQTATITSVTWTFGTKNSLLQILGGGFGDDLPKKIEHGEYAFFFIQNDTNGDWARDMKNKIWEQGGNVRKLMLLVHLATGDTMKIKPAKNVIKMIEKS